MSLVNYSVAPRRQELFLDPKLGTDKGTLPIKVVKAPTEKQQFLLEKKKKFQASKPHSNTNSLQSPALIQKHIYRVTLAEWKGAE